MRRELASAVEQFLQDLHLDEQAPPPSTREKEYLIDLAIYVATCRSAVERDSYRREIDLVPQQEAPARIAIVLDRLRAGLHAVGLPGPDVWGVLRRVAEDCLPVLRQRLIRELQEAEPTLSTQMLARAVRHPQTTTRRSLEDLEALGVVERDQGPASAHLWRLSAWTRARLTALDDLPTMADRVADGGSAPTRAEPSRMSGGPSPSTVPETPGASAGPEAVPETSGAPPEPGRAD